MLAWIQRIIAVLVFGAVAIALALGTHGESMRWMLWAPVLVIASYVGILGVEFVRMRWTYEPGDALRPTLGQTVRAWFAECLTGPVVFLWWQPFRSRAFADRLVPTPKRGFVFVHGFVCNRGVWTPWLRRLARSADRVYVAVDLEPVFGSIERYAEVIGDAVQRVRQATGLAPVVVTHSMGGLAVRWWLATGDHAEAVHRVVTIATPHRGTRLSRRAGPRNAGQMAVASPWLKTLEAMEDPRVRSRFVCFWGHCDNIVFPTRHATLDGADNRHLETTPHVRMVFHPAVYAEAMRLVDELPPTGPTVSC